MACSFDVALENAKASLIETELVIWLQSSSAITRLPARY